MKAFWKYFIVAYTQRTNKFTSPSAFYFMPEISFFFLIKIFINNTTENVLIVGLIRK